VLTAVFGFYLIDSAFHAPEGFRWLAAAAALAFLAQSSAGLMRALASPRLTLGPLGVRHERWMRARAWRWDEISDIKAGKRFVSFQVRGRRVKLPAVKGFSGYRIERTLRAAQARWAPTRPTPA
jgi:hypothetical protein